MTRGLSIVALTTAALLTVPAAAAKRVPTSERYGYSTFRTQSGPIHLLVDGYPASLHPHDAYIPIPVAIARVSGGKSTPVTPESFTLIDAAGNAVPTATYAELRRSYGKLTFDRTVLTRRPLALGTYYGTLLPVGGTFFPPPHRGVRIERIEVPPFGIYGDVLYFPMPPAGISGVLTLELAVPGGAPISVRFVATKQGFAQLSGRPEISSPHGA